MIDWASISSDQFVYLTAELLRTRGFSDIHMQGSGPDGGLDLFATEIIAFSVGGARPFRWGIQCKFSVGGGERSVTDRDIYDVEGIMRSDRFVAQGAKGYMLVTNRRIAQNVVERLTGIDRQSSFRTAILDGVGLESVLLDQPALYNKYFGELRSKVISLGTPLQSTAVTPSRNFRMSKWN